MAELPPCDSGMVATLRRWRRIWAVAAIHGEAQRLDRVLGGIADRLQPGDRVVFLGNYLGYGPDVGGAIDRLIAFRRHFLARTLTFPGDVVFLRGWQEEVWHKLMQLQIAVDAKAVFGWMLDHGMAANLAAYSVDPRQGEAAIREGVMAMTRWTASLRAAIDARPGHRPFLNALRHAARSDDDQLLFVHAGFDPTKPLELQNDTLWWGAADVIDQAEPFPGFGRVVRGFDRQHAGLKRGPYAVSLDGGAGFGGPLLAAAFDREGVVVETLSG